MGTHYANYELSLKIRLVNGSGFVNSGIQMRSVRVPENSEMSGYQVDAGIGWWGKLYDESRRNKVIAEPVDPAAIAKAAKDWDWNDYRILCEGPRIRSWINGVAALDYTEKDAAIPLEGHKEPRAQKKQPKHYSYLTSPRAEYKEIPHRGKSRSLA